MSDEITRLLRASAAGDAEAARRVMPLIYEDLRAIGRRERRRIEAHTLDTTGLVHEAYLRLNGQGRLDWAGRRCYFAYAARAMRNILCDQARRRGMAYRHGGRRDVDADAFELPGSQTPEQLLAIDQLLTRLERLSPRMAQVVELRVFAGLEFAEIAEQLATTERTAFRDWRKARAMIGEQLGEAP